MNKKQIENIINKCTNIPINIEYKTNKEVAPYDAYIISETYEVDLMPGLIVESFNMILRRGLINMKDNTWTKAIILHEIGHAETQHLSKKTGEKEYYAQEWAILKARKLKWKRIESQLLEITKDWRTLGWNEEKGKYRRYILANRIAKQKGLI